MWGQIFFLAIFFAAFAHAAVISDDFVASQCLPANASAMSPFEPTRFFDGHNWFAFAAPPGGAPADCVYFNATMDVQARTVQLTQTISTNRIPYTATVTLTQDASGNTAYNYHPSTNSAWQLIQILTDYYNYAVLVQCLVSPPGGYGLVIVTRRPQTTLNGYSDLMDSLKNEGFNTDLQQMDVSGCPQML